MKKLLVLLSFFIFVTSSNAEDVLQNVSSKISESVATLIPGEGYTEVSIDLREYYSPDYSILAVREIAPIDKGKIFTQFSLFNTEALGDERIIGNLGFGARKLSDDNTIMYGINNFLDYDLENEHLRGSLGLEARSAVMEFNFNYYEGLGDQYNDEIVLGGYELRLASQIPYLHWAKFFLNDYVWYGEDRDDIEGRKMGSEMQINKNFSLKIAYDNKDKKGLSDEWYSKLSFIYPGTEGPTAMDNGLSDTAWKESKDMSEELLSKVNRQNKIMIEFKGSSKITRTD